MAELIDRIELHDDGIKIALKIQVPCAHSGVRTSSILGLSRFVPLTMKRRGVETRIVFAAGNEPPRKIDPALLKAVSRAREWFDELASGRVRSRAQIARREGVTRRYVERLARLAFVAPAIVEAICRGQQPAELSAEPCSTASTCRWNGQSNATCSASGRGEGAAIRCSRSHGHSKTG